MRRWFAVIAVLLVGVIGGFSSAAPAADGTVWVVTKSTAERDLGVRFKNIRSTRCTPDRTSASKITASGQWWQRFWCTGHTHNSDPYRLLYRATGQCESCWNITKLTGVALGAFRGPTSGSASGANNGSVSGASCPSGWYRNVDGNCIPGPSNNSNLPVPGGPTAVCRDGTYSYSQHRLRHLLAPRRRSPLAVTSPTR